MTHVKNPTISRLAAELALMTGESRTEAIRGALEEKLVRLSRLSSHRERRAELVRIFGGEIRTMIRAGGKKRALSPEEVQELLAYGP